MDTNSSLLRDPVLRSSCAVWLAVVMITVVSWALGANHGLSENATAVVIISLAVIKSIVVAAYFMELRDAPRRLAYASAGAIALIALQGVAITGLALRDGGPGFQTASAPGARPSESYVLLSFSPEARAGEIASFFKRFDASVVDGPRANGFFKVRVGDASLSSAQLDAIATRMKGESAIVSFVAPAP